jgi:UPF0755 protein
VETTKKRRKRKKNNIKIKLIVLFISAIIIAQGVSYYEKSFAAVNSNAPTEITLEIPPSSSTTKIAEILYENGLIRNKFIFKLVVKNKSAGNKLRAGKYTLNTGMDIETIIGQLSKGGSSENTIRFTIPEGYEIEQMAEKLSKEGLVNKERFLQLTSDKKYFQDKHLFLKELEEGQSLEGFLFPSTYEIFINSKEEELIEKMLSEFEKIYDEEIKPKMEEMDISLNEIITLASIIEREGKVDKERELMSAVFHNRLKKGMLLQSCATVQYALGERKEVLSEKDTRVDSPYNTYIHKGLPPGPIASPGKSSLIASVNPADVDYLFFVLTGDDGTHTFTNNYKDHLNAKPKK